jgi:hypothetical protein
MKQVKSSRQDTRSRKPIILAGCVVLLIGIATAVLVYRSTKAPFRTTVLEVDDTSIKMKYFLKRVSLARTNPRAMLQTLADEQIMKQTAPQPPYRIRVSDEDIDRAIKEDAATKTHSTSVPQLLIQFHPFEAFPYFLVHRHQYNCNNVYESHKVVFHYRLSLSLNLGSSKSLTASPNIFIPYTTIAKASPGQITIQGA